MCRKTLTKHIDTLYKDMVDGLKEELAKHDYICITADLWTGDNRYECEIDDTQRNIFCVLYSFVQTL